MKLRQRLKDIDLRLTELSDYMQVSRPTMYKYIESFDAKEFDDINKNVLMVFNFIVDNKFAEKKSVISFIINEVVNINNKDDTLSIIKNYLNNNPTSNKSKFLEIVAKKDTFDPVVNYLVNIEPLLSKKKLNKDEETILKPYYEIIKGGK